MLYSKPSTSVTALLDGAAPNLGGALTFSLKDAETGSVVIAPTTAGIVEIILNGVHTGSYLVTFTAPAVEDQYLIAWDDGTAQAPYLDDLIVSNSEALVSDGTYVLPGTPFVAGATELPVGSSTVYAGILSTDGHTIVSDLENVIIREIYPGAYIAEFDVSPPALGNYILLWFDGTSYYVDPLVVVSSLPVGSTQFGTPILTVGIAVIGLLTVGSVVAFQAQFRDRKGILTNPDFVDGWAMVGTDASQNLDFRMRSPGLYEASYQITKNGNLRVRVESSGLTKTAKERKFVVPAQKVTHI